MSESATARADQITSMLHAPGAPFELSTIEVNGVTCRVFAQGPTTLAGIYRAALGFAERDLFVYNGQRIGYAEAFGRAAALQDHLRLRGIGAGSRVAILLHNRPEWMIAFIAITALGASAVLLNSRGTAAEIAAALDCTDCALLITDGNRAKLLAAPVAPGKAIPLILVDAEGSSAPDRIDFATVTANWKNAELTIEDTDPDSEACVMFTSGTTGGPKGARLSHRGALSCVMNVQFSKAVVGMQVMQLFGAEAIAAAAQRQPAALLVFPLFHSSGCYSVFLPTLLSGGKIVIMPKWNAEQALDLIEREKIGGFSGSPTMWWDVLQVDRSGRDLSALISMGIGGQALHPKLMRDIVAAFPRAMLGVGYGMTETNGSVCQLVGATLLERPTTSGRALPTADLKIVDDDGNVLPTDGVGEIWVRGAMVMLGYCQRPEATRETLQEGWIRTGDLGRVDADGFLHVVDRKKNMVISGGENISCSEVEGAAMEIDAIAQCVALGVADERLGERLLLAVVLREGAAIDDDAIKRAIGERIALYKVPRDIVRLAELPYNAMGKVNRAEVLKQILAR